jgi:hypothetical protein
MVLYGAICCFYYGRLDGTRRFTHRWAPLWQAFWLSDSIHWLEFRRRTFFDDLTAYQYSIWHPEDTHPQLVPLSSGSKMDDIAVFNLVSDHRLLGCERFASDKIKKGVKVVE